MLLPTKHLKFERSLLKNGEFILLHIKDPKTISSLWYEIKKPKMTDEKYIPQNYDWFILTLDFLYALNVIEIENGMIRRVTS